MAAAERRAGLGGGGKLGLGPGRGGGKARAEWRRKVDTGTGRRAGRRRAG